MRSLNKWSGVFSQCTTILALVLLLTFFVSVAPVSGADKAKNCASTCDHWQLQQTGQYTEEKHEKIYTYKINGVEYVKWADKTRTCYTGYKYKVCHHRSWCDNTKACANVDDYITRGPDYKKCDSWVTTYRTVPA